MTEQVLYDFTHVERFHLIESESSAPGEIRTGEWTCQGRRMLGVQYVPSPGEAPSADSSNPHVVILLPPVCLARPPREFVLELQGGEGRRRIQLEGMDADSAALRFPLADLDATGFVSVRTKVEHEGARAGRGISGPIQFTRLRIEIVTPEKPVRLGLYRLCVTGGGRIMAAGVAHG